MSKLSVKPPPSVSYTQDLLFELPPPDMVLPSAASARTHYGRTVEEIIESLLGLEDIKNSGNYDVVYDAYHRPSETYCEVKSVFESSAIPIYDWRRKKDREAGVPLVYMVGLHRCRNARTLRGVWEQMSATLQTVLILPFRTVDRLAKNYPKNQLVKEEPGTRMGYKRKGYCEGYRNVPVRDLRKCRFKSPVTVSSEIHGFSFQAQLLIHQGVDWEPESFLAGGTQ